MACVSPSDRDAGSVVGVGMLALLLAMAGLVFPPAILPAMIFAHVGWWTCVGSVRVRGFRWAMAAMVTSHGVLALWLVVVGGIVAGPRGVMAACILLMLIVGGYAIAMRSAAVKYALVGSCCLLIPLGLLACSMMAAREIARRNNVRDNLRTLGMEMQRDEQFARPSDELGIPPDWPSP